jgi:hypothetical protein
MATLLTVLIKIGAEFTTSEDVINQFKVDCVLDEISEIMEFNETSLAEGKMTQKVFLVNISGYKMRPWITPENRIRVPAGVQIEREWSDAEAELHSWELDKNSKDKIEKVTKLAGWYVPFKI